jgi:hypothetical protein
MELNFSLGKQNPLTVSEEPHILFWPGLHAVVPVR